MPLESLFTPFVLKSMTLKNRVVMAPMTRSFSPNGLLSAEVAPYYRRRAAGEVGLIVTEGTVVDRPASANDPNVPHFYGSRALEAWRHVVEQVHSAGGLIAPQLWHVGGVREPRTGKTGPGQVDTPSAISSPGETLGEPMSESAIADTVAAFARAAAEAERIGCDAVEIHAAHGYLIDQFFWEGTNRRTDRFGGDAARRNTFACEVVKAMRAAVHADFPIIIRVSQWKQQDFSARIAHTPEQMAEWLEPLAAAGADCFHCSQRRFWEPEFDDSDLNFAGWAKKLTGLPTITVGSVGLTGEFVTSLFQGEVSKPASLDKLLERLERGEFDLVAVGRALLGDPEWMVKVRDGRVGELKDYGPEALQVLF